MNDCRLENVLNGYYQSPDASFPDRTRSSATDDAGLRFVGGITV